MIKINKDQSFNIQDITERKYKLFQEYSEKYVKGKGHSSGMPFLTYLDYADLDTRLRMEEESWWKKMEKEYGLKPNSSNEIIRIRGDFFIKEANGDS